MKTTLISVAVVVLMAIAGGAGYYLGDQNGFTRAQNIRTEFINQRFAQAQGTGVDASQFAGGQQRGSGQGATQFVGRPTATGTVKAVEGNKITVTQQDGSTVTVTVDDKTIIQKQVTGAIADVQVGMRITVTEQGNAKRIQLLPSQ
jgi:hypothetical protein